MTLEKYEQTCYELQRLWKIYHVCLNCFMPGLATFLHAHEHLSSFFSLFNAFVMTWREKANFHCLTLINQNLNTLDIINCHRSIILLSPFPRSYLFVFDAAHSGKIQSHDMNYLWTEGSIFRECIDASLLLQIFPRHLILFMKIYLQHCCLNKFRETHELISHFVKIIRLSELMKAFVVIKVVLFAELLISLKKRWSFFVLHYLNDTSQPRKLSSKKSF